MASWLDEAEASIYLADQAAVLLRSLNPEHELLRFRFAKESERVNGELDPAREEAIRIEMKDRFWERPDPWRAQPGTVVVATVTGNYYLALKEAIKKIDPIRADTV